MESGRRAGLTVDLMQKARELADAIGNSDEVRNYRMLEAELQNDSQAKEHWFQLYSKEKELQNKIAAGREVSQQEEQELKRLWEKAGADPLVSKFLKAQLAYFNLIEGISFILREAVDLEKGETTCSGCTGCNIQH